MSGLTVFPADAQRRSPFTFVILLTALRFIFSGWYTNGVIPTSSESGFAIRENNAVALSIFRAPRSGVATISHFNAVCLEKFFCAFFWLQKLPARISL
jgi:hypothetical protein